MSKAFTNPSRPESTKISQTLTTPSSVMAARIKARIIESVWVAITIRWRGRRSTIAPAMGESKKIGICEEKLTAPSSSDDPVSLYTSQDCATFCIHVPIREISCPPKKSWKLRCRIERKATANLDCSGVLRVAGSRSGASGSSESSRRVVLWFSYDTHGSDSRTNRAGCLEDRASYPASHAAGRHSRAPAIDRRARGGGDDSAHPASLHARRR